jgi:hypothetical protein
VTCGNKRLNALLSSVASSERGAYHKLP